MPAAAISVVIVIVTRTAAVAGKMIVMAAGMMVTAAVAGETTVMAAGTTVTAAVAEEMTVTAAGTTETATVTGTMTVMAETVAVAGIEMMEDLQHGILTVAAMEIPEEEMLPDRDFQA